MRACVCDQRDSLTGVDRTEYEGGERQRSDAEWKFGMDAPPQNAFVSGWPKKARGLDTSGRIRAAASRNRWVVPTQHITRKKWSFYLRLHRSGIRRHQRRINRKAIRVAPRV